MRGSCRDVVTGLRAPAIFFVINSILVSRRYDANVLIPSNSQGRQDMIREKSAFIAPGLLTFLVLVALELLTIAALVALIIGRAPALVIILDVLAVAAVGICFGGFLIVSPNEAQVLQLFGNYAGTVRTPGWWWTNPFTLPRRKVSQRVRNFESSHLKVNDHDGNPIEIAAIVVWRVTDTAEAVFQVD